MTGRDIHHSQRRKSSPAARPGFLTLPERTSKPRRTGISQVLDNGISLAETEQRLAAAANFIDVWKFGWGTAYIDPALDAKLDLLAEHGVLACPGGTLLEIAWRRGVAGQYLDWAEAAGFGAIEVSCGSVAMTRAVKDTLIGRAVERFTVLTEVGSKDPSVAVSPSQWAMDAAADREAGAHWVVTEGRESGTVGLFSAEGDVRRTVVDAVVASVGLEVVLFEAPQRAQQAWLIQQFGPNVNLGNIGIADALAVETLRLGLRSDTMNAPFITGPAALSSPNREAPS